MLFKHHFKGTGGLYARFQKINSLRASAFPPLIATLRMVTRKVQAIQEDDQGQSLTEIFLHLHYKAAC